MFRSRFASSVVCLLAFVLGGCPSPNGGGLFNNARRASWLDGSWFLDYSNSPNPTQLTFTDGKVTSELAGGTEPVAVTWATTATVNGNDVAFAYGSQQTLYLLGIGVVTFEGSCTLSGTIQDDGSVSGTTTVSGTFDGVPVTNTVGFIMRRL
jgi:hypothetical protein